MKVFYIAALESDYLQDSLYAGFCQALGQENVYEYPFNPSKHFQTKIYPRNLGYVPQLSAWGILKQRCDLSFLKRADLVVVASTKPETFQSYLRIQNQISSNSRVIFLDGGDRPEIGGDLDRLGQPDLYSQATKKRPFDFRYCSQ